MKKKAFMIMNFSDKLASTAYEHCIRRVCEQFNLEIRRADEVFTTNPVYDDILREIREASVIIADISTKNPNVYYELGISHILKQSQTIMITHQNFDTLPFDISHFRILRYDDSIAGSRSFEKQLTMTLKEILKNYGEIYKDEFGLIADVLISSGCGSNIAAIIGLKKSSQIIKVNKRISCEGTDPNGHAFATETVSTFAYEAFVKMEFISLPADQYLLTEKGKAFATFLETRGFKCNIFNNEIFTPGYKNMFPKNQGEKSQQKDLVNKK
jgi:hypothetical protein